MCTVTLPAISILSSLTVEDSTPSASITVGKCIETDKIMEKSKMTQNILKSNFDSRPLWLNGWGSTLMFKTSISLFLSSVSESPAKMNKYQCN